YEFKWYYDTDTIEFSADSVVTDRPIGRHRVVMTDAAGCIINAEIVVTQPENLSSQSFVQDAECYNEPSGLIDFHMAGGTPPYMITWVETGATEFRITDLLAEEYTAYVLDTNACDYDTILVIGQPDSLALDPIASNPGCPDDNKGFIQLNPTGGTPPYFIVWEDGSSDAYREGLRPNQYSVEVTDDHFCTTRDTIILVSEEESCLSIPTAFTPNADGTNDTWEIEGMIYYPDATMRIFNRWGVLVYETKNYDDNRWDGKYRGVKVPLDSYHFIISFTSGNSEITGHVTVIK
ncbi:MAG: gliding motility-associated C-terminal domain-containing protein, partial [Bacteroidales bacterium]|nr:gliding motility-associated C-terminal domain-containing protein [Bacteroidales bacterium]